MAMLTPGATIAIRRIMMGRPDGTEDVTEYNLRVIEYDDGLVKVSRDGKQEIYNLRSGAICKVEIS